MCHTDCLLRKRGGNVWMCPTCVGFTAANVSNDTAFRVDPGTCEVTAAVYNLLILNEFRPVVEGMIPGASEDFLFANEEASVRLATGVVDPDLASTELMRRQVETHLATPRTDVKYWVSHGMDHISTFVAAGLTIEKWLEWNQPMSVLVQIDGVTFESLIEQMELLPEHIAQISESTEKRLFAAADIAKCYGDVDSILELCDNDWALFATMNFSTLELEQLGMTADWLLDRIKTQVSTTTGRTMSIEDLNALGNEWATTTFLMRSLKVPLNQLYLYSDAYSET